MIAKPLPISGSYDLTTITGGLYGTSIFYGETPELITLTVLSGESNVINAIEFQSGSSYTEGSLIIGSQALKGVYQVYNMNTKEIIFQQEVSDDNVEDFS